MRITSKRILFDAVLCICLCVMISACGSGKSEVYDLDDYVQDGYLLEGAYLSVKEGMVKLIEQEGFQAALEAVAVNDLPEKSATYTVKGIPVQILSATVAYDSPPKRVTVLFENIDQTVASIGIPWEYTLEAGFKDCEESELSLKQQEAIIKKVAEVCQLSSLGVSAVTREFQLQVPGERQYAAVVFYPYVCTVQISVEKDSEWKNFEIEYPVVNQMGCLDGLYAVVEYDTTEAFDRFAPV